MLAGQQRLAQHSRGGKPVDFQSSNRSAVARSII
jgi:hypothetical protein